MLNKQIEDLRRELNRLIAENAGYEEIYRVSTQLDLLINAFYSKKRMSA